VGPFRLPIVIWVISALLPLGTVGYVVRFYSTNLRSYLLWTRALVLSLLQIAVFLLSFALIPRLAFLLNVAALPFEYYLLDKSLKRLRIHRD
jgi:hypothetical protein